jgi:hypothetical protein
VESNQDEEGFLPKTNTPCVLSLTVFNQPTIQTKVLYWKLLQTNKQTNPSMQYPNPKFLLQDPTDDDSLVSLLDDSLVAGGFSCLWLLHRHGSGVADLVVNTLRFVLRTKKAYIVRIAYIVHFTKVTHLGTYHSFFFFGGSVLGLAYQGP